MRYLILIAVIIFTTSCSVKKRNYRDGYYVDWAFSKKKADKKIAQGNTVEKPATKNSINANSFIIQTTILPLQLQEWELTRH